MNATILTAAVSLLGVLAVGVLIPLYLVARSDRQRREDQAEAARLHREDREAEWARQDATAARAEQAARDLAAAQEAIAAQAAETARLLLDRQDESAAAQREVAIQAAEAARLAAENGRMVADSAKQAGLKLDTIHTLVNSNMTTAMESERAAVDRELSVMRELIDLRRSMGYEPSQAVLSVVAATEAKLAELDTALANRARVQEQVNQRLSLDAAVRQQDAGSSAAGPAAPAEPKTGGEVIGETQGVGPPPGGEPKQMIEYPDTPPEVPGERGG